MPRIALATRFGKALRLGGVLLLMMVMAVPAAAPAAAQDLPRVSRNDLPRVYRDARFQRQFAAIMKTVQDGVVPRPYAHIPSAIDTVGPWIARQAFDYVPPKKVVKLSAKVRSWKIIRRIEQPRYERQFEAVKWAYLGNNYYTSLDTVYTKEIRARMQARFGSPTKTLAELDFSRRLSREEYIQFEYWFIVNDSIPIIVMDVNGPFDRGIVVACDHRYRNILYNLRQSFLGLLIEEESPAPFVDYYYSYAARRWYRTGFDGQQYFTHSIGQPNLARGRPQLGPSGG